MRERAASVAAVFRFAVDTAWCEAGPWLLKAKDPPIQRRPEMLWRQLSPSVDRQAGLRHTYCERQLPRRISVMESPAQTKSNPAFGDRSVPASEVVRSLLSTTVVGVNWNIPPVPDVGANTSRNNGIMTPADQPGRGWTLCCCCSAPLILIGLEITAETLVRYSMIRSLPNVRCMEAPWRVQDCHVFLFVISNLQCAGV